MNDAPNTGQSEQWFARALETLPGGVSSPVRARLSTSATFRSSDAARPDAPVRAPSAPSPAAPPSSPRCPPAARAAHARGFDAWWARLHRC